MPIQPEAVRTGLTATSTQLTPESGPNTTAADNQLSAGLTAFGNMLGQAANFAKKRQVAQDIRTAENAALREEAMPGGLLPIAVDAYNDVVETNTANRFLSEYELMRAGAKRKSLITASDITTDEKNNTVDTNAEEYFARSAPFITNPEIREKLRTQLNVGRLADKKDILVAEDTQKKLVVIEGMNGRVKDHILLQKEEFDGTGIHIEVPFIKQLAKEATRAHPNIDSNEALRLAFKIVMKNDDVIANPDIVTDLLTQEINPGFIGSSLYISETTEGRAFKTSVDAFFRASDKHFSDIEAAEVKALKVRAYEFDQMISEQVDDPNISTEALYAKIKDSPWLGTAKRTALKSYVAKERAGETLGLNSPIGNDLLELIVDGSILDENEAKVWAIRHGISLKGWKDSMGPVFKMEASQRKAATDSLKGSIEVFQNQSVSLLKTALSEKLGHTGFKIDGDNIDLTAVIEAALGVSNKKDTQKLFHNLQFLQGLHVRQNLKSIQISRAAAVNNLAPLSPEFMKQQREYSKEYQDEIQKAIDNVLDGLHPATQPEDASPKGTEDKPPKGTGDKSPKGTGDKPPKGTGDNSTTGSGEDELKPEVILDTATNGTPETKKKLVATVYNKLTIDKDSKKLDPSTKTKLLNQNPNTITQQRSPEKQEIRSNIISTVAKDLKDYTKGASALANIGASKVDQVIGKASDKVVTEVNKLNLPKKVKDTGSYLGKALPAAVDKVGEKVLEGSTAIGKTAVTAVKETSKEIDDFTNMLNDASDNTLEALQSALTTIKKSTIEATRFPPDELKSFNQRTEENIVPSIPVDDGMQNLGEAFIEGVVNFSQVIGKGLAEPMSDEMRNQGLADIRRNIEQSGQTLSAGTKSKKNDGGMAGRVTPSPVEVPSPLDVDTTISPLLRYNFGVASTTVTDEVFKEKLGLALAAVSILESRNITDATQNNNDGAGRGLFQYERTSALTAINRHKNVTGEDLTGIDDFSELSRRTQVNIAISDHSERKGSTAGLAKIIAAGDDDNLLAVALAEYQILVNKSEFTPEELRVPENAAEQQRDVEAATIRVRRRLADIKSLNILEGN